MSQSTNFDHFLHGTAVSMHSHYLSDNWVEERFIGERVCAYVVGMGEHALYCLYKVAAFVAFIFIDLALAAHYCYKKAAGESEISCLQSKKRLNVGLLILGEAFPALGVDAIGLVCPPAAYKIHIYLKETITQHYFEKWGLWDSKRPKERFQVMEFWVRSGTMAQYEGC